MQELTREQLWQWYVVEQRTSVEIADLVGLRANTIRARLQKVGIPVRSRGAAQLLVAQAQEADADDLVTRYRAGASPQDLAKHFQSTRPRIVAQLKRLGVYEAGRKYTGEHHWCTGTQQSVDHVQKRQATKAQRGSRNGPVPVPVEDRFWQYVEKTEGCWRWTGTTNGSGYGMIYDVRNGEKVLAHRASWEIHNGPIPEGKHILHQCDNPACVNPTHLRVGTHKENMQDMTEKYRGRCAFSDKVVIDEIISMFMEGMSASFLAKKFNVSVSTIYNIVTRRTYSHIKDIAHVCPDQRRTSLLRFHIREKGLILTDDDVRYIRQARRTGAHSSRELAQIFGVTSMTIYNIVRGRSYSHVTDAAPA